jgi:hypothetical protein
LFGIHIVRVSNSSGPCQDRSRKIRP